MVELLQQIVVIIANSGAAVLITNVLKNIFPGMDGKSDKVAAVLAMIGFVIAWFVAEWFDPNLIQTLLPEISVKLVEWVEGVTAILTLLATMGLLEPIYAFIRKLKLGIFSKSFSE